MLFSEGELVKLRCKLEGQPLPQVTWFYNEKEIEASERYTVISDFYEFILMMPKPSVDMTGNYTIVAKNQHGVKQMSTQLTVEGLFTFFHRRRLTGCRGCQCTHRQRVGGCMHSEEKLSKTQLGKMHTQNFIHH